MLSLLVALACGQMSTLAISKGSAPIEFKDITLGPDGKFVVPEGALGRVLLLGPGDTRETTVLGEGHPGGDRWLSSAIQVDGLLIATAKSDPELLVSAPGKPLLIQPLTANPEHVRMNRNEIWVTEPAKEQIEVYTLTRDPLGVSLAATIAVPAGPQTLTFSDDGEHAYTLAEEHSRLLDIDVAKRTVPEGWIVKCRHFPVGVALTGDGMALVGCSGGLVVAVSLKDGKELAQIGVPEGVTGVAYNAQKRILYVPSKKKGQLTFVSVGTDGTLTNVRTVAAVPQVGAIASSGNAIVIADPQRGRLLRFDDR